MSVEHEWDEDGNCAIEVNQDTPCWKFSLWDIAGIAFGTAGGVLISIGTGFGYVNRECQAHAEWKRSQYDAAVAQFEEDVARAEMAGALEGIAIWDEDTNLSSLSDRLPE